MVGIVLLGVFVLLLAFGAPIAVCLGIIYVFMTHKQAISALLSC